MTTKDEKHADGQNDVYSTPLPMSDDALIQEAKLAASLIPWNTLQARSAGREQENKGLVHFQERLNFISVRLRLDLRCSLMELASILSTTDPQQYTYAMPIMWGKGFRYGNLVHQVPSEAIQEAGPWEKHVRFAASESSSTTEMNPSICVATADFAKPLVFQNPERWCYLDYQLHDSHRQSISRVITTLDPDDTLRNRRTDKNSNKGRYAHNTIVSYLLQQCDFDNATITRVTFYCVHLRDSKKKAHAASSRVIKNRMIELAKSCNLLSSVISRRRFGYYLSMHPMAVARVKNVACNCCLGSLRTSKRAVCCICQYAMCRACIKWKEREVVDRRLVDHVLVCLRCERRSERQAPNSMIEVSMSNRTTNSSREDTVDIHASIGPGTVVQQSEARDKCHRTYSGAHAGRNLPSSSLDNILTESARCRTHVMAVDGTSLPTTRTTCDIPELGIIISLACKELQCTGSFVTVLRDGVFHVMATNLKSLRGRTFKSYEQLGLDHLLLDAAGVSIKQIEKDERKTPKVFTRLNFFCSFEIANDDGIVIGTLCCVDTFERQLDSDQYEMMNSLTRSASKILKVHDEKKHEKE